MPLYAGVCETNITPPPGVWMSGYASRLTCAVGVHDDLSARALILDNGRQRVAVLVMDLIALEQDLVQEVRAGIAARIGTEPAAILLHCTHTHGGPTVLRYRGMGVRNEQDIAVLIRKLIGVAGQAADNLRPAHLTYGEASAQIGVNRRQTRATGQTVVGADYGGAVDRQVRSLCVHGEDGRIFAMLFHHACHATTMGSDNLLLTADWPGAAVAHLKRRFQEESVQGAVVTDALPFCLQGCCGDTNPFRRGTWEAVAHNGRVIADAAHTALWSAHGRQEETLEALEETLLLPLLPPPPPAECAALVEEWRGVLTRDTASGASEGRLQFDRGRLEWAEACLEIAERPQTEVLQPFALQRLNLGGVQLLGFPAEMFLAYQTDFAAQSETPVLSLGYANGCWNYLPTEAEYARGGYEVLEAHKYYGTLMFAPECEAIVRSAVYRLLGIQMPDRTPYPLQTGRIR